MKKLLCLLICLLIPACALAAPARETRGSALSDAELATMRGWLDGVVRQALPLEYDENTYVGAHVYSCVEDGGCYVLECDVYLEDGSDSLPAYAPDTAITWLCPATVCVQRDGGGYQCVSCEVGDYYQFAGMAAVAGDGYSLSLPDLYAADSRDAYDYSCYDAAGALISGVRVRTAAAQGQSAEDYARSLIGEESDSLILRSLPEVNMVTAQADGMYVIVYAGADQYHSLTVTYPEEREAEFTLYCEFMRNSFVVEGEVNG